MSSGLMYSTYYILCLCQSYVCVWVHVNTLYCFIFICPGWAVGKDISHGLSQFDLSGLVSGSFASGLPGWLNINKTLPFLNGILMRFRKEMSDGGMRWRGRRRMYPQPSCSVSNMALVPHRKKREIEQINTDHQILYIPARMD